jgi:hypothetical protein
VSNPLRRVRDLLFVDADTIRVNCGRCGKELLVRLAEIRDERVIDCEECKAAAAVNHRRDERASRQSTLSRRMSDPHLTTRAGHGPAIGVFLVSVYAGKKVDADFFDEA